MTHNVVGGAYYYYLAAASPCLYSHGVKVYVLGVTEETLQPF